MIADTALASWRQTIRRRRGRILAVATLVMLLFAVARSLDPLGEGLTATYFTDANWTSAPARSLLDAAVTTSSIAGAWRGGAPETFSATWTGSFVALRGGDYTFATTSDDGSWVYVDQQLVVDNGGRHEARRASGSLRLERGTHAIFVRYFQDGGSFHFELAWARDGAALEPMPSWTFFPGQRDYRRVLPTILVRRIDALVFWLWILTLVVIAGPAVRRPVQRFVDGSIRAPTARLLNEIRTNPTSRALAAVVAGSFVLNVVGIWWGLPSGWAGDEITPKPVLIGLAQRFTGGWFDRYPPLQFYILSAVFYPWLLLKEHGWVQVTDLTDYATLLFLSRVVSLVAGVGTLCAVYACGARAFGRRAGVFAAAMAGVLSLFVYYAKTANPEVPYVFWFALSLVFYVRLVDAFTLRDAVLFGACGVLSICTKDQAYGLYLLSPFPVLSTLWESKRARGVQRPLAAALCDWRLTAAGVTTVALFLAIHNVPFNARGFASHVRDIVGPGSEGYRIVDRSTAGQLTLLGLTLRLDQMSWGWPFLVASIAGMVMAILVRTTRRTAVALLLMIVSYYLGFIDVILYNYDRYLLPVCIVQALFGGLALDRLLAWSAARGRAWSRAAIGGAFAYTLLYAGTIDVLMVRDSRYTAERWLVAHAGSDRLVATIFPLVDLPRLNDLRAQDLGSVELIRERAPSYFVLNADYARAVPPNTPLARLISGFQHGTLGYRRAFSYRTPNPWPWLPGAHYDLVGPRLETQVFSSLRHINPTIEIYERSRQ